MQGKCFGCGSTTYARKDGNHECDLCAHCKHVGHREVVCMGKFMGRSKGQKAAVMGEESDGEVGMPGEISEELEEEWLAATNQATLT